MAVYYDSDFDFSELHDAGMAFLSTLQSSPSSPSSPPPLPNAWHLFHESHSTAQFFKPKRYLPQSFSLAMDHLRSTSSPSILEVGSGAGAALFPLLSSLPSSVTATAIDIAPSAIDLLKSHSQFDQCRICAKVCDVSTEPIPVPPSSVDVAFLVFTLSAIAPPSFPSVLLKLRQTLKPDGMCCFRDYGLFDLTMLRFKPSQHMCGYTFRRGDGTLSTFFELDATKVLFEEAGLDLL
eukprot:CAMPEP_0118662856 /NCGR_PEP_ID=MMETSP0785-20121206/17066_1 /TAXON_ID=91992 /ORGANISM="Bolidomonas pacifica, Strain CCMP 1866" /LENGTH=235 /DNA_ID=CAMNT_0006556451 /DNA_START=144 /DNA_END=848 /DNA_ORIENTATION=-